MSLRVLVTLLCLLGVASAAQPMGPRKLFCMQCKTVEDTIHRAIETSVTYSGTYFGLLKQSCSVLPKATQEQCTLSVDGIKDTTAATIRTAEQRPCEQIYGCQPMEMNGDLSMVDSNPEGFCRVCEGAVSFVFEQLGLEAALDQGADLAVELCKQLRIVSEEDCVSSVSDLMKKVELPKPDDICESVGLCEAVRVVM